MKYVVIIQRTETGCSAYAPDLPGCTAMGDSVEDVRRTMHEAVAVHIAGLREEGLTVPGPESVVAYVDVAA
jgi:predicted RNase H-like HicB family nuclease